MSSERIEFLYKQERVDPEKFLVGRKIEKAEHLNTYTSAAAASKGVGGVEGLQHQSVRTELQQQASGGTMSAEEIEAQRVNIDMQAKMRDDPLFLIRKREEEDKRELLKNPLKMKRLHEMLNLVSKKQPGTSAAGPTAGLEEEDDDGDSLLKKYLKILQQKNEEKAKNASKMLAADKRHKRDRHKRRSRSRSRSASSASSSSGDSLLEGYMNALQQKQTLVNKFKQEEELAQKLELKAQQRKERQRLQPGGGHDDSEDGDDDMESKKRSRADESPSPVGRRRPKPYTKKPPPPSEKERPGKSYRQNPSDERRDQRPGRKGYTEEPRVIRDSYRRRRSRSHSRSPRRSRSRSRSSRDRRRSSSRSNSRSQGSRHHDQKRHSRSRSPPRAAGSSRSRKLSPTTMERKRQEMAMAAQERNAERVSNVRRYAEEERRELDEEEERRKSAKSSFLQGTILDHADRTSVGDRVQRNKFNVQRRGNDLISGGEKFLNR